MVSARELGYSHIKVYSDVGMILLKPGFLCGLRGLLQVYYTWHDMKYVKCLFIVMLTLSSSRSMQCIDRRGSEGGRDMVV